jgi:hypothetical protein
LKTQPTSIAWLRELARPYLRGYRARAVSENGLRGYEFTSPMRGVAAGSGPRQANAPQVGFFVGYVTDASAWPCLAAEPPECAVFAFVEPRGSAEHRRLVAAQDALVRRTFTYIRWLTHRPPRFQFFERDLPALVRHRTMRDWPEERREHFSRNFFIETLAWLVRSGLVRKLAEEVAAPARPKRPSAKPKRRKTNP